MIGHGPPQQLAGGGVGQVTGGDVGLGPLVRGEVNRRGGPQGLLGIGGCGATLGHEGGADPLAPLLVVQPEDGHLGDPGHRRQDVLDLGRVHVDTPADDEVVAAAREIEVAVGRQAAQVPHGARRPAPGPGGGLGVAPVAEAGEVGHVGPDDAALLLVLAADCSSSVRRVQCARRRHVRVATGSTKRRRPARARPTRAGVLEPLGGRADGELRFGRAVELPHGAGVGRASMVARLTDSGQGAPAWARRRSESKRSPASEAGVREDALEVRRDQEGGGRAMAPQDVGARLRRRSGSR